MITDVFEKIVWIPIRARTNRIWIVSSSPSLPSPSSSWMLDGCLSNIAYAAVVSDKATVFQASIVIMKSSFHMQFLGTCRSPRKLETICWTLVFQIVSTKTKTFVVTCVQVLPHACVWSTSILWFHIYIYMASRWWSSYFVWKCTHHVCIIMVLRDRRWKNPVLLHLLHRTTVRHFLYGS